MYKTNRCDASDDESDSCDCESYVTTDDEEVGFEEQIRETILACTMLKLDPRGPVARIKARCALRKRQVEEHRRRQALARMPVDLLVKFIEGECPPKITGAPQASKKSERKKMKKKRRQAEKKKATKNGGGGEPKAQQAQTSSTVEKNYQSDAEVQSGNEEENAVCTELKCKNKFKLMRHQINSLHALNERSDDTSLVATQTSTDCNQNTQPAEGENAPDLKMGIIDKQHELKASVTSKAKVGSADCKNASSLSCRFDADYQSKLACIDCIASLKANGQVELCDQRELSAHVCSQTLLLAVRRVASQCSPGVTTDDWSLVREPPSVTTDAAPLSYLLCEHVTRGTAWMCTTYPFCRQPHNEVERTVWTQASSLDFNVSAFLATRRAVLPLEDALTNLFSLFHGRLLLGCRTCFASGRYSPCARNGFSCEPQVDAFQPRELIIRHSWRENECLLHRKGQRFAVRPIEPRPKPTQEHGWQHLERLSLCENGVRCVMSRCKNAHTRVELAVWRLEQTYSTLTRAELVDRSTMFASATDAEGETKETKEPRKDSQTDVDLDCDTEGLELANEIDPADILPRDGRKKAPLISMALEQDDDDDNDEYRFEVKLTRREQRELRKLERLELMEEQRRKDALRRQKADTATTSCNVPKSNQAVLPTPMPSNPFIRPMQIAMAQPQPAVVRSTVGFVLEAEYSFRLVCIDCIKSVTALGEVDFDVGPQTQSASGTCHVCQQTLLVVLAHNRNSHSPRWSLIRELPNSGSGSGSATGTSYALCGHVTAGRLCPKLLFCDSPHNEDERLVWSNVRLGCFDIAAFVSRHRKLQDAFKPALGRLLQEHHGRFAFLCRACYMNTGQRVLAGPSPNGQYCNNPSVTHLWAENACMVHCRSETQFGVRPIEIRPLASDAWQHLVRYSLCKLGIRCSTERCMSAHTKVELAVWRFERTFLQCTRQMLIDLSAEYYETSASGKDETASSVFSKPKSLASSSSDRDRLALHTVPESVNKWNQPSPASECCREAKMTPSNQLSCQNLELHNKKIGPRTTTLNQL